MSISVGLEEMHTKQKSNDLKICNNWNITQKRINLARKYYFNPPKSKIESKCESPAPEFSICHP